MGGSRDSANEKAGCFELSASSNGLLPYSSPFQVRTGRPAPQLPRASRGSQGRRVSQAPALAAPEPARVLET